MDITRYELEKYITLFKKEKDLQDNLILDEITLDNDTYISLIELLLNNKKEISENTIEELSLQNPPFLRNEITEIFNKNFITFRLYQSIFYTFKYSTIKKYFKDNWQRFMPDIDVLNIENSEKLKVFQEALMMEFDRLADTIDEIYNIQDIDKTPSFYLDYLGQLIGYERAERELLVDSSFRELVKNIIEIYKIKGTNFSFEIFFGFLGFDAKILEYWFDKRYYDSGIAANVYTTSSNKNEFNFYLTPIKPTDGIPPSMVNSYPVLENEIVETLGGEQFNFYISSGQYTLQQLLDESPGYPSTPYTFFKTNVVEFNLSRFEEPEEVGTQQEILEEPEEDDPIEISQGVSEEELRILELYARFLTPIFIARKISIILTPFQDNLKILTLKDMNRKDPRSLNNVMNNESMFHLYSGKHPEYYYWEDGLIDYNIQNNPRVINPGGNFISGYFKDTYNIIFNKNEPTSIYSQLASANPLWTQREINLEISRLIKNKELFTVYSITDRDLMYPLVDLFYDTSDTQLILSEFQEFTEDVFFEYINNDQVIRQLFVLFMDYEFNHFTTYSTLEPYENDNPKHGKYKPAFDNDDKGSLFDSIENPEDFYDLENKKFINQFAGVKNTFFRTPIGQWSQYFFTDKQNSILRNSSNLGYSSFEHSFMLDHLDLVVPPGQEFVFSVETSEGVFVNITTEDGKIIATESFSNIW